ncbi:alcohol dehydrogenase catalytic domain-containing protein [Nonomuraea sp. NEAU-A123]|uniref:alcohol dehydrogenase catalytic domain-containing protein n=1 Tax=Nonomuraea sp. NEAU-A123 TaxID=2839649 RepID=UPI0027DEC8AA|nr:alcohol dehydrogenase catalytic domain-containing protein [Nonomuraea sp. NEAU-A123]
MRATLIYGAGDVRVENVPDPVLREPTDALVRVLRSCVCGSDLWPYKSRPATGQGDRIGHEFLGVVEDAGSEAGTLRRGDVVVAPFVWADNTCDFCREGLQTSCRHGGQWGADGVDGGQGEAVRVPQAAGTLVKLPVGEDSELLPSLLTLSDVFPTGHPLRGHRRSRPGHDGDGDRRRRGRADGGAVGQAARRRADHPDGPAHGTHRPGPRFRRHRRRRGAGR